MRHQHKFLITRSTQAENVYGPFAAQILQSEGLAGFTTVDLDTMSWPDFQPGDLVLVTRCLLRKNETQAIVAAVKRGVSVAFLQPSPVVIKEFGGQWDCGILYPGRVKIAAGFPGAGAPIQTHLPINCCKPPADGSAWQVVADAFAPDGTSTAYPAVVRFSHEQGKVAFFFYDLAEAVARIRFGNPDLASYVALGTRWPWVHAGDLFVGHLDPELAHLPQADFHAQLMANVLSGLSAAPLGRFWYYEDMAHRSAAVFQSDEDGSTPEHFAALTGVLEKHRGGGTFYLMRDTKLDRAQVDQMRARGHTFGPHVDPRRLKDELHFAIPEALAADSAWFDERFGARSATLQSHCAPWSGYMAMVPHHVRWNYRLLFAYFSAPKRHWAQFMCGSGRPLKFFDRDGTLYDCWQQPLPILDDATLVDKLTHDADATCRQFDEMLNAALTVHHTAVAVLSHPISFWNYSRPVLEYCIAQLATAGVPIYNADHWLEFVDRRAAVTLTQSVDARGTLCFTVANLQGRLPLMVPMPDSADPHVQVWVDGVPTTCTMTRRLEENWLWIPLCGRADGMPVRIEVVPSRPSAPKPPLSHSQMPLSLDSRAAVNT